VVNHTWSIINLLSAEHGAPETIQNATRKVNSCLNIPKKILSKVWNLYSDSDIGVTAIGRYSSHRDEVKLRLKAKRERIKNGTQSVEPPYDQICTWSPYRVADLSIVSLHVPSQRTVMTHFISLPILCHPATQIPLTRSTTHSRN